MTRWLPNTLKTRALLILFIVFSLSQLASVVIFEHNRDETIMLTEATDLADRIIGIVNLARGFPAEDRQQILAAAETQFLTMHPNIVSIDEVACQDNDFSRHMSDRIQQSFDELPGFSARVCVRSLDKPQFFSASNGIRGFDVLVFTDFPDSSQTVFHTLLPEGTSLLEDTVILYLLLVCLAALILGWVLINRAIRPFERLAKAADEFGVNIDAKPMLEEGPREVSLSAQAFNRMQGRLSRLIHSQTEMLAAISHDLRSAVTRLQLRIELLEESEEKEGLLRTIYDMRLMVQSVLDFARGHNPQDPMRRVNLSALVESLCEDLIEEGFDLQYHCQQSTIYLRCRPTDIRRGVHNIIDNAIKYGDRARVYLESGENTILIAIEDCGPGLPEAEFESVTRPFYRLDQSRGGNTAGVGLGLAITVNILHSMGGNLSFANRLEGGLRVEMSIPANVD